MTISSSPMTSPHSTTPPSAVNTVPRPGTDGHYFSKERRNIGLAKHVVPPHAPTVPLAPAIATALVNRGHMNSPSRSSPPPTTVRSDFSARLCTKQATAPTAPAKPQGAMSWPPSFATPVDDCAVAPREAKGCAGSFGLLAFIIRSAAPPSDRPLPRGVPEPRWPTMLRPLRAKREARR